MWTLNFYTNSAPYFPCFHLCSMCGHPALYMDRYCSARCSVSLRDTLALSCRLRMPSAAHPPAPAHIFFTSVTDTWKPWLRLAGWGEALRKCIVSMPQDHRGHDRTAAALTFHGPTPLAYNNLKQNPTRTCIYSFFKCCKTNEKFFPLNLMDQF